MRPPSSILRSQSEIVRQPIERWPRDFDDLSTPLSDFRARTFQFWTGIRSGVSFSARIVVSPHKAQPVLRKSGWSEGVEQRPVGLAGVEQ